MKRSERQEGWRDSAWNRARPVGLRPMGRGGLALESTGFAKGERSGPRGRATPDQGSGLGFLAAPWARPAW